MRINTNVSALNIHRQMTINTNNTTKSMEKLSSGLRINRAGDDAAGLSISEKMRSQIVGLEMASRNAQDGVSLIQTAEGALSEVSNMLIRIKELSTQKSNGTYSADDIDNINLEITSLSDEIDNIYKTTKFNGRNVFTGLTDAESTAGNPKKPINISISENGSVVMEVEPAELDKTLALDDGSTVAEVEEAIVELNKQRSVYGSLQNRLEHTINNLNITNENLTAAESRIRDVDMAKERAEFTKNNILNQAAQSMLAQANQFPQSVLQLLK